MVPEVLHILQIGLVPEVLYILQIGLVPEPGSVVHTTNRHGAEVLFGSRTMDMRKHWTDNPVVCFMFGQSKIGKKKSF